MKYDVEELYSKELLTVAEAAYLLGDIKTQNVYSKTLNGKLEYVLEENADGRMVKRIVTKSVYDYILRERASLFKKADSFRLPRVQDEN